MCEDILIEINVKNYNVTVGNQDIILYEKQKIVIPTVLTQLNLPTRF